MIVVWGGREGPLGRLGSVEPLFDRPNHENGPNLVYEPLTHYSAFADKTHMRLAESSF
jgi:hypothetical protein